MNKFFLFVFMMTLSASGWSVRLGTDCRRTIKPNEALISLIPHFDAHAITLNSQWIEVLNDLALYNPPHNSSPHSTILITGNESADKSSILNHYFHIANYERLASYTGSKSFPPLELFISKPNPTRNTQVFLFIDGIERMTSEQATHIAHLAHGHKKNPNETADFISAIIMDWISPLATPRKFDDIDRITLVLTVDISAIKAHLPFRLPDRRLYYWEILNRLFYQGEWLQLKDPAQGEYLPDPTLPVLHLFDKIYHLNPHSSDERLTQ